MRFGKWRGVPLTFALAAILGVSSSSARADGWRLHHTIPREVPAYDYTTGGPYYAPPVPWGHYAKDYHEEALKALGSLYGCVSTGAGLLQGGLGGLCGNCGSLFHGNGGCGSGHGCGSGDGSCLGHACGGLGAGGFPASSCGFCAGRGLFHHGSGGGSGSGGCFDGLQAACGQGVITGLGHKKHFAPCHASTVAATGQAQAAPQQIVAPSAQACEVPGCTIAGHHSHLANLMNKIRCHFCGGGGCGGCRGLGIGDPCAGCGGSGLLGHGRSCGLCGGCGLGHGGTGCGLCGGRGCANCLQGMASKAHGLLGTLAGTALGLLHPDKVDWFVGAGGPVPLTPGYVPYIVSTRSPRDYFAFPPMNPNDP
jgi:hypothetical protein